MKDLFSSLNFPFILSIVKNTDKKYEKRYFAIFTITCTIVLLIFVETDEIKHTHLERTIHSSKYHAN